MPLQVGMDIGLTAFHVEGIIDGYWVFIYLFPRYQLLEILAGLKANCLDPRHRHTEMVRLWNCLVKMMDCKLTKMVFS